VNVFFLPFLLVAIVPAEWRRHNVVFQTGLNEDLARYRVRGVSVSSRRLRSAGWVWHIYRNVEQLSLAKSAWCFAHWSGRAWLKRREF